MDSLTNLSTIRALCRRHGFTLSKGYGQHFLTNPGICPKLCDAAGIGDTSQVLEIGPGFGTLTRELSARAARVVALEVDARLLPVLGETLADCQNVAVVPGDVLKTDLAALIKEHFSGPVYVAANLPYNITSPIVMRLLEGGLPLCGVTVMVQKEAALRLTAAPGTREGGAITYAVHYYTKPRYDFSVSPGSFTPPPKVQSAVITLTPHASPPLAAWPKREKRLFALIRAGFAQRRKTLANAAAAGLALPREALSNAIETAGLPPAARPEQLTLEDYIRLEAALWPNDGA